MYYAVNPDRLVLAVVFTLAWLALTVYMATLYFHGFWWRFKWQRDYVAQLNALKPLRPASPYPWLLKALLIVIGGSIFALAMGALIALSSLSLYFGPAPIAIPTAAMGIWSTVQRWLSPRQQTTQLTNGGYASIKKGYDRWTLRNNPHRISRSDGSVVEVVELNVFTDETGTYARVRDVNATKVTDWYYIPQQYLKVYRGQ